MGATRRPRIHIPDLPSPADREAIVAGLKAFNKSKVGPSDQRDVAVLIVEEPGEAVIGGLWGRVGRAWLCIDLVFVPEELRGKGLGRHIVAEAERIATAADCCGIHVSTYSFQARGFYEKLGYAVFGVLEDHPPGECKYFLKKRIA